METTIIDIFREGMMVGALIFGGAFSYIMWLKIGIELDRVEKYLRHKKLIADFDTWNQERKKNRFN